MQATTGILEPLPVDGVQVMSHRYVQGKHESGLVSRQHLKRLYDTYKLHCRDVSYGRM